MEVSRTLAPRSTSCVVSDALPWSMRVEGPLSAGIVLVPSRKRVRSVDEAGVGEDVAAGQLDAITDRAAHPHARDGDVDVVALDALPAREREAVSRVDGLDRTVQAVACGSRGGTAAPRRRPCRVR